VQPQGKIVTNKVFSSSFKCLCKTAVDWVNSLVNFWHGQCAAVTCCIAGVDVEWPLMKVIITFTFCCDNLWESKFMALEKPGKLGIFFSCFVATLFFGSVFALFFNVCALHWVLSSLLFYHCFVTLEVTYFRAELVQLIVSRSDEEREEKYFDCWSYQAARWIVNETAWRTVPKLPKSVFENRTADNDLRFLNFEVDSVRFLENRHATFSSGPATPYF